MKNVIFIFMLLVCVAYSQSCDPDDEFPDNNSTTDEWDKFMEKLEELTFKKNYSKNCTNEPSQIVAVNASSQILWDLRFDLYNEKQKKTEKTIEQCYTENPSTENCNVDGFRECMKNARIAMYKDLISEWWERKIDEYLTEQAKLC